MKMRSLLLTSLATAFLCGCSDSKTGPAEIPKDLNKEIPTVTGTAGGPKTPPPPATKVD